MVDESLPDVAFCIHCNLLTSVADIEFHRMTKKHKEAVALSIHEEAYDAIDELIANKVKIDGMLPPLNKDYRYYKLFETEK